MLYVLSVAALFALLYGEASYPQTQGIGLASGLVGGVGVSLSLLLPPLFLRYDNNMNASGVLTRLMQRAALGSGIVLATTIVVWLVIGRLDDPRVLGELYAFAAIAVFLFQGFAETMTRHTMYLQQTHQYNSNQLVAVLLAVTLLIFTLILYFLAFDLARPADLHAYLRDLTAITLVLIGYGRAVYLMAHH